MHRVMNLECTFMKIQQTKTSLNFILFYRLLPSRTSETQRDSDTYQQLYLFYFTGLIAYETL